MKRVEISQALQRKYPEWIDLVVSRSPDGQVNVMPVGWSMIASSIPPLYAVAIHTRQHTARLIQASGEFVVAVPTVEMGRATLYCGTHSGRDGDKIGPSGLILLPASVIQTPLVEGAVYNLECKLHQQVQAGDHLVFFGEIVAAHADEIADKRLMNFGDDLWACAQPISGKEFRP
jgi:flavin reductase (DIM6/NTAB) family NADH-FMN oxidoreductase RutF